MKLSVYTGIIAVLVYGTVLAGGQADSLRNLIANETNTSLKARYLHELAQFIGNDSVLYAIELENTALSLADHESDIKLIIDIQSKLGNFYYVSSDYKNSIKAFEEALLLSEGIDDKLITVKLLNNLGVIHQILGMYEVSLNYLNQSIELKKELADSIGLAKSYNNISVIYKNLDRFSEAYVFTMKALTAYEKIGSKPDLADVYNNLGTIYEAWANYDTALYYYYKSLKIKSELKNLKGLGNTFNNIGMVYLFRKQFDSSFRNLSEAYSLRKGINDRFGLVSSLHNLGLFYLAKSEYDSALACFQKSLDISKQESMLENLQRNFANISRVYDSLGNTEAAYKNFRLYEAYKDTLTKKDIQDQLSNLAIKYETERLEQEKALLKKQYEIQRDKRIIVYYLFILISVFLITILVVLYLRYRIKNSVNKALVEKNRQIFNKQQEVEKALIKLNESEELLRELNASKDKFFNIIAHDLKNPFGTVVNFSELLMNNTFDLDEDEKLEIIRVIKDTTQNTLQLLENLLTWSRTQTGRIVFNPQKLLVNQLLDEILGMLKPSADKKRIDIKLDTPPDIKVWADENMLKTILRNLISNAIKYTGFDGDIIISTTCSKLTACVICVQDNGIGISNDVVNKLFRFDESVRSAGTDNEIGTGLGLILCKEFVDYHKGKIWVNSTPGKGSRFCVSFPAKTTDGPYSDTQAVITP